VSDSFIEVRYNTLYVEIKTSKHGISTPKTSCIYYGLAITTAIGMTIGMLDYSHHARAHLQTTSTNVVDGH